MPCQKRRDYLKEPNKPESCIKEQQTCLRDWCVSVVRWDLEELFINLSEIIGRWKTMQQLQSVKTRVSEMQIGCL